MKTVLVKYFCDLVLVAVIKVQNSKKNIEARTCSISILDNNAVSQIPNLPAKFKLYVGAMVMLTDNISVSDRQINRSIGTVKHLDRRSNPLCSTIYMKF